MNERLAVDTFDRCRSIARALETNVEPRRRRHEQKRPEALPAAQHAMAHGGNEPLGRTPIGLRHQHLLQPSFDTPGCGGELICERRQSLNLYSIVCCAASLNIAIVSD